MSSDAVNLQARLKAHLQAPPLGEPVFVRETRWSVSAGGSTLSGMLDSRAPHLGESALSKNAKWVILPIGIPGCGRSDVVTALALSCNFFLMQKPDLKIDLFPLTFEEQLVHALREHDVVIINRNNFLSKHRARLRSICRSIEPAPKLLALYWNVDGLALSAIHSICIRRILSTKSTLCSTALWKFLSFREPLQPGEVDAIVELDIGSDLLATLLCAIGGISEILNVRVPDNDAIFDSICRIISLKGQNAISSTAGALDFARIPPENPHLPAYRRDVTSLVKSLQHCARSGLVRQVDFPASDVGSLTCWRFRESAFYSSLHRLPILARGFWTVKVGGSVDDADDGGDTWSIIARGYDKFFAVQERSWSTWNSVRQFTTGPYHVMLKSDGCLILIAALSPDRLIVTSKHSYGPLSGVAESHAQRGEQWLQKHLCAAGRSADDLADCLWGMRWTLLCELCDPEYEEHVIPVDPGRVGLRLHGINDATIAMKTQSPNVVYKFAKDWGFVPTPYVTVVDFDELQSLVSRHVMLGTWEGKPAEGLVIRAVVDKAKTVVPDLPRYHRRIPPFPNGHPVFFKMKFLQPYLLWLAFREVTKIALGHNVRLTVPSDVLSMPEAKLYFSWVLQQIQADPAPFAHFMQHRGVIAVRERFLQWIQTPEGSEALMTADALPHRLAAHISRVPRIQFDSNQRWLILPIGLPGCGITALSVALSFLFGFRHVEYDRLKLRHASEGKSWFRLRLRSALKHHVAVIADGYNHRRARRSSLRSMAAEVPLPLKTIAIHWEEPATSMATAQRLCASRIASRDNLLSTSACDQLIWRAAAELEPLRASEVDAIVSVNYEDSFEQSVRSVIKGIMALLDVPPPSGDRIEEAIRLAGEHRSEKRSHVLNRYVQPLSSDRRTRFALLPEINWEPVLRDLPLGESAPLRRFWTSLKNSPGHIYAHTPIMVVLTANPLQVDPSACLVHVVIREIVHDERVIVAIVHDVLFDVDVPHSPATYSPNLHFDVTNLHCVLGRRNTSVSPEEGSQLAQRRRKGQKRRMNVTFLKEEIRAIARLHLLPSKH